MPTFTFTIILGLYIRKTMTWLHQQHIRRGVGGGGYVGLYQSAHPTAVGRRFKD